MGIAQPTRLKRGGPISHNFELVHIGRAAQFEQHVDLIIGDQLRGVAVGNRFVPVELVDPRFNIILHAIRLVSAP